jgi:hypothetical protein
MKSYFKKISYFLLSLTLLLGACEPEESLNITSPEPSFVLNTPGISTIFLNFALPDNPAFTIGWVDEVNAGANYNVEMALDAEFTNPILLGSTEKSNFSMTTAELNQALTTANIKSYTDTVIYMRLNTGKAFSNIILFQIAKFAVNPPSFTSPANGFSVVLTDAKLNDIALKLEWNDPEITDNSTVKIKYNVEMDLADNNFANPILIGSSDKTSFEISHDNLNDLIIASGAKADVATNFEFRLKAVAKTASGDLVRMSDKITLSITAFKAAIPDNLFMVGSFVGWNADNATPFSTSGNGVFTQVQTLTANTEFKFILAKSSFEGDYGEDKNNPGKIVQEEEQNIKVANAGTYLITVDFNTLSYKLTNITTVFMVGSFVGWDANNATQFNTNGNGVYTQVQTLDANAEFKFILNKGSYDGDFGEDPSNVGKIVQDDEQNVKITTTGTYVITVDFNTLSFNITEQPNSLFMVGSFVGWDANNAVAFTKTAPGVFELTQALTASDEFKFIPAQGSFNNDWGASKNYNGMLVRDDENNVKSPGNGAYKITVNYNKGTFMVQ